MSPLLLLKILSPNQIHQLALMLLLLLSFMSVKPRKLDLLSGTPHLLLFFFFTLSEHSLAFLPSGKASVCAFLSLCPCQLHPARSLSLVWMTSLLSVISLFSPPLSLDVSHAFASLFCSAFQAACPPIALLLLLLRHSSVHAAGEPVTDESACLSLC